MKSLMYTFLVVAVLIAFPFFGEAKGLDTFSTFKVLVEENDTESLILNPIQDLEDSGTESGMTNGTTDEGTDAELKPDTEDNNKVKRSCGPEKIMPVEICEIGQGVLCLNSPPFSTENDYVIIKGTVDKRTSIFSHIRAYSQHEYTKSFNDVKINSWGDKECWEEEWASYYDGCIDEKGFFGVKIPLKQFGPYTIMFDAVSINGEAVSKNVRTTRAVGLGLKRSDVTITPDPALSNGVVEAKNVNVTVDLLHNCTFCDFIGTSTGGVMITVLNVIETPAGDIKTIRRRSNISKNGLFDICVPLMNGTNRLGIKACNAATGDDDCPRIDDIFFEARIMEPQIDIVSPEPGKFTYDVSDYSVVPLEFRISDYEHPEGVCQDGDVVVRWNRSKPHSLCPAADGSYIARLKPEVGVNLGKVEVVVGDTTYSKAFTFGWGKIINPYLEDTPGWVKEALSVRIGARYINDKLRPFINDFLNSDGLTKLIDSVFTGSTGPKNKVGTVAEDDELKKMLNAIKSEVPHCSAGGSLNSDMKIELVGRPKIGGGKLHYLKFETSAVSFELDLNDIEAHLKIFIDEDGDGAPDAPILPLMVGFKELKLKGKIEHVDGGKPLLLLSSDSTDCDYVAGSYCRKRPALITPENYIGNATKGGAFVRCDDKTAELSDSEEDGCVGLNVLNAQTGLLTLKILDIVNDMLYCQGSAAITYLLREKLRDVHAIVEILDKEMAIAGGVDPLNGELKVDSNGVKMIAPARAGGFELAGRFDERVHNPGVGVLSDPGGSKLSPGSISPDYVSLSISTEVINQLFFQLAFQKDGNGILDWNIDEVFFNEKGFDFVKECDAFDPYAQEANEPSVLCQLRPRIVEMLGPSLSTHSYFTAKQPIRLDLKGSRRIAPQIKLYRANVPYELPAEEGEEEVRYEYRPVTVTELQVPDIELTFYALAVDDAAGRDDFGNPKLLLDENGEPVPVTMIAAGNEIVPILKVQATLIIALEIMDIETSVKDPSKLALKIRPIPQFFKLEFDVSEGSNSTIVSSDSLLSSFREKVKYGIEIFGDPDNPITLTLPKVFDFGSMKDSSSYDLFDMFGLERLILGNEGLKLEFDPYSEAIKLSFAPALE